MSNELAITAVTIALRNYLVDAMKVPVAPASLLIQKDFLVSTLPLHKVRDKFLVENVVNLLLYRVDVSAAWRNQALPSQTKPGENGPPPLALDLEYLITAYGEEEREDVAHFILGQAMRFLHDFPIIPRERLKLALPEANVQDQIERVKITPRPLSVEELSKLWTVFQTQYRVSAAYHVSVVLIESRVPARSALPVLTRGKDDRGIESIAGSPPSPDLARGASGFGGATLGGDVVVEGERLNAAGLVARVSHRLTTAVNLPTVPVSATELRVALPPLGGGVAKNWPAGVYALTLVQSALDRPDYPTREVFFALAPSIVVTPDAPPVAGDIHVTIMATPQIRTDQSVFVIWDGAQIVPDSVAPPPANADDPSEVKFTVNADAGIHRVRLRVDGVDSILMRPKAGGGFEFDPNQSVVVQP
jgi:hypothetical protein